MGEFDLTPTPDLLKWYYGAVKRMIHDGELDAEDISLPSGEEDIMTATKVLKDLIKANPSFASCLERIDLSEDETTKRSYSDDPSARVITFSPKDDIMDTKNKTKSSVKKTVETKTVKKKKTISPPRKTTEVSGIWDKLNKL